VVAVGQLTVGEIAVKRQLPQKGVSLITDMTTTEAIYQMMLENFQMFQTQVNAQIFAWITTCAHFSHSFGMAAILKRPRLAESKMTMV
jgi:hypothetical protein